MRCLCGSPFCGLALERRVALVIQPPENRRAFRHESVAPQRIRAAVARPTSIASPRRHVLSVTIDLRDNQKACQDSLASKFVGRFCETLSYGWHPPRRTPYKYPRKRYARGLCTQLLSGRSCRTTIGGRCRSFGLRSNGF